MSSILRKGKRLVKKKQSFVTKQHLKHFYKKLEELNEVVLEIFKEEDVDAINKDNILEIASKYTDMVLEPDSMEYKILMSKVSDYKDRIKQRDESER